MCSSQNEAWLVGHTQDAELLLRSSPSVSLICIPVHVFPLPDLLHLPAPTDPSRFSPSLPSPTSLLSSRVLCEVELPAKLHHSPQPRCLPVPWPPGSGSSSSTGPGEESLLLLTRNPAWPLRILRLLLDFYFFPNLLPKFKFPPVSPQLPPETGNPRRPAMGGPSGWEAPLQGPYLPPTGVHRAPAEHLLESQMRIRKRFVRWGVFQSTMTHHTPHHGQLDSPKDSTYASHQLYPVSSSQRLLLNADCRARDTWNLNPKGSCWGREHYLF